MRHSRPVNFTVINMTSLSAHKEAERDLIARAAEKYLNSGGQIEVLPGPTVAPLPARRHPKARPAKPRRSLRDAHSGRYHAYSSVVIEMRERGALIKDIAKHIGMSATFVSDCLTYFGVRDAEADKAARELEEMIEKIGIMAGDGHSARYIGEQLNVTTSKILYQADKNNIRFRRG